MFNITILKVETILLSMKCLHRGLHDIIPAYITVSSVCHSSSLYEDV